jgi:hypothetical protein
LVDDEHLPLKPGECPEMRSERQGRLIDSDKESTMEPKKREGHF